MKINSPFARIIVGGISTGILIFGITVMVISPMKGNAHGWAGMVFGPFAIVVGSLFLGLAMLLPAKLTRNQRKSKHHD